MKKVIACALSLTLLLSLSACSKPQAEQPDTNQADPATTSTPADISTPKPDNAPDQKLPVTQTPAQISDTTPAAPAENEAPQDQAEPAVQGPAKPEPVSEPVKTETPTQTEPQNPPAESKPATPAEPEPATAEPAEPTNQNEQKDNSGWTLTGFQEPEDPNDAPKDIYEAWPGYEGPKEGYIYIPGDGYFSIADSNHYTGISLPSWEEVFGTD